MARTHRMNGKVRLILVGGALAASALGAAPASAADRVLSSAPPGLLGDVHAYGGTVVWGVARNYDETTADYFVRDAHGTRRIPLDPYVSGLDLGARRGGGTQAILSACRNGRPCTLGTYDLHSGAARSLSSLSRLRGSERSPSIWNGRVVFARERSDPLRTPSNTLGLFVTSPLRAVARVAPMSSDLRGSRLAYITSTSSRTYTTRLYVATVPRNGRAPRSCLVARATDSQSDPADIYLSNPVLTETHVLWLRKDERGIASTDRRASIRRRPLPGRGCHSSGREERSREIGGMDSFAEDRGRFFYTAATYNGRDELREATDPRFTFKR